MAVTLKGNNGTYEGTSEDSKPLDVPVNTEFDELDTGKTYYFDGETWNEEPPCEGSGFTPTAEQLAAMNSGITAEDVEQITTNENNISSILDGTTIDSFEDVETALSGKQATLTTAQLAAVNSGVDSTKVAQIETNKNNILLKADKISFGFSGNPNPAVYEKDWDFVPDGIYLLAYICSQDASTRRGVSVYMFTKYTTNHIVLFTPVAEASGAIITSCVASGSAGAETITFTLAQRGYHTATAIQVVAF